MTPYDRPSTGRWGLPFPHRASSGFDQPQRRAIGRTAVTGTTNNGLTPSDEPLGAPVRHSTEDCGSSLGIIH